MKTSPTPKNAAQPPQEWLRVSEALSYARVTKPVLYKWINEGLVKTFSNRQRGQIKGTRLVSFDSLRRFMESRSSGGNPV